MDKNQDFPFSDTFLCKRGGCVPLHLICVLKSFALFAEEWPKFNKQFNDLMLDLSTAQWPFQKGGAMV